MVANGGCHHLKSCFQKYYVWHRSDFLSSFWVSLSTFPLPPQPPRGEYPGPLLSPQGSEGLGAGPATAAWGPGRRESKAGHVGPAFISQLQRGANKPCPHARAAAARCLQLQPVLPHPLFLPRKKTGPNSASWTPRGPRTAGRASNSRRGPQFWAGATVRQVWGVGGGARRLKPFLSHFPTVGQPGIWDSHTLNRTFPVRNHSAEGAGLCGSRAPEVGVDQIDMTPESTEGCGTVHGSLLHQFPLK